MDMNHNRKTGVRTSQLLLLLDLPLDILGMIIERITDTNDLTNLALTCSNLHALVIPYIYARFDIVWPDNNPANDNKVGVDALTYGLATLVMSRDTPGQRSQCAGLTHNAEVYSNQQKHSYASRVRQGNNYAQYTRKFSLGNGPQDWVNEYLISRESGKMLGTLTAIAIGKMRNLEDFHWDMPSGILRDIWLALSSLAESDDDAQRCKLEKVWIRWHDNRDNLAEPGLFGTTRPTRQGDRPTLQNRLPVPTFTIPPYSQVVFPTFSVLPPLRSLSVLDIDELSYVQELSILIERSLDQLQELRIGLAKHAVNEIWAIPSAGAKDRIDAGTESRKLVTDEGILAKLFSGFHATLKHQVVVSARGQQLSYSKGLEASRGSRKEPSTATCETHQKDEPSELVQVTELFVAHGIDDKQPPGSSLTTDYRCGSGKASPAENNHRLQEGMLCGQPTSPKKLLSLQTLDLERLYLSKSVLFGAIDWTKLKAVTILGCQKTDNLWKALRKSFAPRTSNHDSMSRLGDMSVIESPSLLLVNAPPPKPKQMPEFRLKLVKIYTDTVSSGLLAFIKDALEPDTLETLFLRQRSDYASDMTLEQIYKCAIRRHRASLTRLLIDSDTRSGERTSDNSWRRWCLSRDLLTCIMSNRMKLRELSISLNHKDWHYFLQRLPEMSALRSLHVTHIAQSERSPVECREAAQHIVDVVALRPEIQLCFIGMHEKCFEILETNLLPSKVRAGHRRLRELETVSNHVPDVSIQEMVPNDDSTVSDVSEDEAQSGSDLSSDDHQPLDSPNDETDDEVLDEAQRKPVFKLREILFYDDKVAIFKARHGRL